MQDYKHVHRGDAAGRRRADRRDGARRMAIIGAVILVACIALVVRLANVIDTWGTCV